MKDRDALFPALQLRGQGIVLRKRTREEPTKLKHATSWEFYSTSMENFLIQFENKGGRIYNFVRIQFNIEQNCKIAVKLTRGNNIFKPV